ncbi:MAG: septum formation protein Maf [Eubacteriaceae bacterium]|nr:septum formation protein Maf [Eubacteriaceae bacterium]
MENKKEFGNKQGEARGEAPKLKKVILASASPRRKELIGYLPIELAGCMAAVEEAAYDEALSPEDNAVMIAAQKALDVKGRCLDIAHDIIISADTYVISEGRVLGKPKDSLEAKQMIGALSGRTHRVLTGVCIICEGVTLTFCEETEVTFNPMTNEQIEDYIKKGESIDKAGAYGIQGAARLFIKGIKGNYENVMGLPVSRIYEALLREKIL